MARSSHEVNVRLTATDDASQVLKETEQSVDSLSKSLSDRFVFTAQDVTRVLSTLSDAFEAMKRAASLAGQEAKLKSEIEKIGGNFDDYIDKLKEVSNNTINTADIISSSSQALLEGIPASKIASLLEAARSSAISMGTDTAKAFDVITAGVAKASPEILRHAGFTIDLTNVYTDFARQLGTTSAYLTETQKQTALLNEVQRQSAESTASFNADLVKTTEQLKQMETEVANTQKAIGDLLLKFAEGATSSANFNASVGGVSENVSALGGVAEFFGRVVGELASKLDRGAESASPFLAQLSLLIRGLIAYKNAEEEAAAATEAAASAIEHKTTLAERNARVNEEYASTVESITVWMRKLGQSTEEEVNAALENNAAKIQFLRDNYRELGYTYEQFLVAEASIIEANAKLTGTFVDQNAVISESQGHYESAAGGLSFYREEATQSIGVFNNLTTAINQASSAAQTGMGSRTGSGVVPQQADLGAQTLAGLTAYGGVVRGSLGGTVTNASLSAAQAGIYQGGVDLRYARAWAVRAAGSGSRYVPASVPGVSWNQFLKVVESGQHAFYEPGTQF